MSTEKIIMYDSPEAGRLVTVTAWEVDNPNGKIYTLREESARWANCTHKVCECGKPMDKYYTKCAECRNKAANERYKALPYKEWDGIEPVCEWDGGEYFFSLEALEDYMEEHEQMQDINLLICEPINYNPIRLDHIVDDTHDEYEPEKELMQMVEKFNTELKKFKPHSWKPGKIRTSYSIKDE